MRIAMLAACPFPSAQGSQVFIAEMCEALASRGHEIELVTYGQAANEEREPTAYAVRRIRRLPGDDALRSGPTPMKPVLDTLLAAELCRTVRGRGFDLVHAHIYEAAAIAAATKPVHRLPVMYHCHGVLGEELPTYFDGALGKRVARWVGSIFDRTVPRALDATVVLSPAALDALRDTGVAARRLWMIAPAVRDLGEPVSIVFARSALDIDESRYVFGYCGNLDAYQNLAVVAEVVARLGESATGPEPLWLVITHARDAEFERMVAAHGAAKWTRVIEVGDFAAAHRAMAACDVFVLPRATRTGFPIKLLNYMAAGRPVVVGPGSAPLLLDGHEGLSVPAGGATAFAEALERLRQEPLLRTHMARHARQKYLEKHTWDAVVPALEEAYGQMLRPAGAARRARAVLN